MNDKIQPGHLERTALVYVRQSSLQQVRDHTEGQRQQYKLADRSRALGFRETVLIDEDQGRSGSGQQERPGFGRLWRVFVKATSGRCSHSRPRDWRVTIAIGTIWSICVP